MQFRLTSINAAGRKVKRTIEAASQNEAVTFIRHQGETPIEIVAIGRGRPRLKTAEKVFFTQNVAVLLASGVPLGEALTVIAGDSPSRRSVSFYDSIRVDLEQGLPLSAALKKYPATFDSVYVSLVEAGENSGELATVMANLAQGIEKDAHTLHQIKSAMIYPAIVLATLFIMGTAIVFFVLPKITQVFASLNVTLPLATRWLIAVSQLANARPWLTLGGLIAGVAALFGLTAIAPVRAAGRRAALRLPVIRSLVRHLDLTRLAGTLSLLLGAGVPIQTALTIAGGTITSPTLSGQMTGVADELARGVSLGVALHQTELPKTFVALVAVGEKSGKTTAVFATLTEHYGQLFDVAVKNFTGAIEPALTLLVGLIVGGAVITIMLPIYQFVGNLQNLAGAG